MKRDDDEPITRRDSGTLATFESTCAELIAKLDLVVAALGLDDEGREIEHEARELLTVFRAWRVRAPTPDDRSTGIARVLDLHRRAEDYLTRRRSG